MSWVILNPDAMCLHCPHEMRVHRLDTPRDGSTPFVVCGAEGCGCKRRNVVLTDPTPAAPDPQPACECKSCRAKRAYGYALGCCPEWLSHGATCICGGTSSAAPDQAEGPQPTP